MTLDELDEVPFRFTATAHADGTPRGGVRRVGDPGRSGFLGKRPTWHTGATSGVDAIRDFDVHLFGTFLRYGARACSSLTR